MFSEFEIEIFKFIFKVFLINSETEDIKIYLVLNILLTTFLMEIIYFNKNKIF